MTLLFINSHFQGELSTQPVSIWFNETKKIDFHDSDGHGWFDLPYDQASRDLPSPPQGMRGQKTSP
jgi:hypothetical protein